jgi:DNA-directed RNA polymerase subunit beta'
LKTPDSGYLTRKLAYVAQNVVITMHDCETKQGITKGVIYRGEKVEVRLSAAITGRVSRQSIVNPITDEIIVKDSELITPEIARRIEELGLEKIQVRSPDLKTRWHLPQLLRDGPGDLAAVADGMAVASLVPYTGRAWHAAHFMRAFHIGATAAPRSKRASGPQRTGIVSSPACGS